VTIRFRAEAATDVGRVRSVNQDATLVADDLFVVADGMGGHNGGEVASHLAIETLRDVFTVPTTDSLVDAVQAANDAVMTRAEQDPSLHGMGTTVVALAAVVTDGEERIAIANVGDSRCYLLEQDRLRQITRDHSVVQTLVDNGQITPAEAESHPQRNILTRALGIDPKVMTDSWELLAFAGDRYVLCSDGLFNEVTEAEIIEVLRTIPSPGEAARDLVRRANEGGGRDNISVVIVDVVEDGGRHEQAQAMSRVASHTSGVRRAVTVGGAATAQAVSDAGGAPPGEGGEGEAKEQRDRRGVSFRTIAFVGAILAVIVAVVGTVVFAGRNTYYVAFDDNEVTIFKGDPDGFLGMDPTVEERTGIAREDVPASFLDELEGGKEFSSLEDARAYVTRIEQEAAGDVPQRPRPTAPPNTEATTPPTTGDTTDPTADDGEGDGTTTTTDDGGISRG
jgi:protein phosphatase